MLDTVLPIEEARIWSPGDGMESLLSARELRARIVRARTAREAVNGADAVILVTDSPDPVIEDAWVTPGTLVVSVGACRPDHREMDPALLTRAWLIVDSRRSALMESGDVIQGIAENRFGPEHIRGELGEVILGSVPPRGSDDDVVVFKSLGLAVEDVAVGSYVLQLAEERGLGRQVMF
jgi:ornithine cyclodeaminase